MSQRFQLGPLSLSASISLKMNRMNSHILGVGVDVVELERIKKIRLLERFAEYFLTPPELKALAKSSDPVRFIASRFAAKEAVIKAFPGFLRPHEFRIGKNGAKPVVVFSAPQKSHCRMSVSISHSTRYAIGYAVAAAS
jgi:holo-[acyl-carrier protein] synthase